MIETFYEVFQDARPELFLSDACNITDNSIAWADIDADNMVKGHVSVLYCMCRKYIDLSRTVGYEMWVNSSTSYTQNSMLDWHTDADDLCAVMTGKLELPLCSLVYYPLVNLENGGELSFRDGTQITPERNLLVLFESGLEHRVEPYKGDRTSIAINFWDHKLEGYS